MIGCPQRGSQTVGTVQSGTVMLTPLFTLTHKLTRAQLWGLPVLVPNVLTASNRMRVTIGVSGLYTAVLAVCRKTGVLVSTNIDLSES